MVEYLPYCGRMLVAIGDSIKSIVLAPDVRVPFLIQ